MFKKRWPTFFLALTLGVLFWVIDALLDFYIFYSGSFLDLLILDPPRQELYTRAIILGSFAIFGYVAGAYIDEVQRHEAQYRSIVENPTTYICRFTPEARLTFANRAYCEKFGIPPDEIRGQSFLPKIPEGDRDFVRQQYQSLSEDNPVTTYEHRVYHEGGEIEWQRWTDHALFNEKGELVEYQSIGYDITERKESEIALQESEFKYRDLFESAQDIILFLDQNGDILDINPRGEMLSGYSRETLLEMNVIEDLAVLEDRQVLEHVLERAVRGHRSTYDVRWKTKGGEILYLDGSTTPRFSPEGEFITARCILRDVTKRVQAEDSLKESEKKYRTLYETMSQGVVYQNAEGEIIDANAAAERILGLSLDQMRGRTSMHPEWRMVTVDGEPFPGDKHPAMVALRTGRKVENVVFGVFHPRKEEKVWVSVSATPQFRDAGDQPYQVFTTFLDVTELVEAEKELRESEEKYRKLFHASTDALFVVDEDTLDILDTNRTAQEMYGYTREEFLSLKATDLSAQPGETAKTIGQFSDRTEDPAQFHVPIRYHKKKDGTVMVVEITAKHFRLQGQRVNLSLIRDITERTMMENDLRRRKGELESLTARLVEADEAQRRQFARDLHDQVGQTLSLLRFNLDRLNSMIDKDTLDKDTLTSKISEAASLVDETSQSIHRVINDLRPPVLDDYGISAALHWYADQLRDQADFDLEVEGEDLQPRLPVRDEIVLFRVTQEALSNVINHARAAHVTVRLEEEEGRVTLEVMDDGRGFSPSDVGLEDERRGWGLINMRERTEVIGGAFFIESEREQGTKVRVQVPRRKRDD